MMRIYFWATIGFLLIYSIAAAQGSTADSSTALQIVSSVKEYKNQVKKDSEKILIELKSLSPNLTYDIRYATTNNFMNRMMYPAGTNKVFCESLWPKPFRRYNRNSMKKDWD